MKTTKHNLVLQDELQPQVGSGRRIVEAKIGYKWVRVRDVARAKFAPTNFKRIKRREWDVLVEQSKAHQKRNRKEAA
jgi:hypothetical protein